MSYLSANDLPPFFHLVHKDSGLVLVTPGAKMEPCEAGCVPFTNLGSSFTQIDAATWVAEAVDDLTARATGQARVRLRNRKSGLYLTVSEIDQPLAVRKVKQELHAANEKSVPDGNNYVEKYSTDSSWLISGDNLRRVRIQFCPFVRRETKEGEPRGGYWDLSDLSTGKVSTAIQPFDVVTLSGIEDAWEIRVLGAYDANNVNASKAEASLSGGVALFGKIGSDLFKTVADIAKTSSQNNVALVFLGFAFVSRLAAGVAEIVSFFSATKEDPMVAVYRTILPAMRGIIKEELHESAVNEALGLARTGQNQLGIAQLIISDAGLIPVNDYAHSAADLRTALGSDRVASLEDCFQSGIAAFEEARGRLEIYDDTFAPWILVATQIVAFEVLRVMIFPEKAAESRARLMQLQSYGSGVVDPIRTRRRLRIENGVDTNTWTPNEIKLPLEEFVAHVDACVDRALGSPSGLMSTLARVLAVLQPR